MKADSLKEVPALTNIYASHVISCNGCLLPQNPACKSHEIVDNANAEWIGTLIDDRIFPILLANLDRSETLQEPKRRIFILPENTIVICAKNIPFESTSV